MGILDDLYGSNNGPVQSNTLMANPDYSAGQQGNTIGGIGNTSGMGLDLNWSTPTTQTLSVGDIFETPAGNYQAVDNGYGQIGLAPMGGAFQTGSDIQYNVASGEHHYGVNPNTGEAWYQQSQGPSASLYSTEYDVPASTTSNNTSNTSSSTAADTTSNTVSTPQYTAADVNALYNQYLNRDAEEAGLNYWLNSLNTGTSMEDVIYNIMQSDEYKSLQGQAGTTNSTEPPDSTGLPPVVDNESSGNVLTAAGLASALSMLMPQPEPTPPAKTGVMGPSSGGSFNPAPIQTLNYSSPELAPIGSSNKIDYVKQMRAGLFKDLV